MVARRDSFLYHTLLFAVLVFLDRITKWWAVKYLVGNDRDIFPGLTMSYALNHGISWSWLVPTSPFGHIVLTTAVMLLLIAFFAFAYGEHRRGQSILFEICILAGGFSNLLDRFMAGGVIDFIDVHVGEWHFATFNVADVCITVGAMGIILRMWYGWFQDSRHVR